MSGVQTIGGVTLTANSVPASGDIETLMLAICADQSNVLNDVARGQATEMQKRNTDVAKLNAALNELRALAPSQDKAGQPLQPQPAGNDYAGQGRLTSATFATLRDNGIDYPSYVTFKLTQPPDTGNDTLKSDGGWNNLMESVKTQIDTLSSSSQLDMIKMQGTINKANQAVDMMTNLTQKFSDVKDKINGNIR